MRNVPFGRKTGLKVSQLALGTGNFGTGWGHGAEPAVAHKIFDHYLAAGGNFIDTADIYQGGQSEQLTGQFIAGKRDELVLATKYTLSGGAQAGNSRKNMITSVEQSLKRLNTDRIDLLWAHVGDRVTPIEEIMRGFDDLVRQGKIVYGGLSNFPAWRVARADTLAEVRGWAPLAGIQIEYSLAERTGDRELLPMAEALGLGVAGWSPLAGGFLTGKYRQGEEGRLQGLGTLVHSEKSQRQTVLLDTVLGIAQENGITATQVAMAWLRERSQLIPILGPRTLQHLEGALAEANLSPVQLARLDEVSEVELGIPHQQTREESKRFGVAPLAVR